MTKWRSWNDHKLEMSTTVVVFDNDSYEEDCDSSDTEYEVEYKMKIEPSITCVQDQCMQPQYIPVWKKTTTYTQSNYDPGIQEIQELNANLHEIASNDVDMEIDVENIHVHTSSNDAAFEDNLDMLIASLNGDLQGEIDFNSIYE